jgi:hypothetical protein
LEILGPDVLDAAVANDAKQPRFSAVRHVVAPSCINLVCFPSARTVRLTDVDQKGEKNLGGDIADADRHPIMTLETLHLVDVAKEVKAGVFERIAARFPAMRKLTVHLRGQWQAEHVTNLQHFTQLTSLTLLAKTTFSGVDAAALSTLCNLRDQLRELRLFGLGSLSPQAVAVLLEGLPKLTVFRFTVPKIPPPRIPPAPKEVKLAVRKYRRADKKARRAEREVQRHEQRLKSKGVEEDELGLHLMQYNYEREERMKVAEVKRDVALSTVKKADEEADEVPKAPEYTLAEWNAEFVRQVLQELDTRASGAASAELAVGQVPGLYPVEMEGEPKSRVRGGLRTCSKAEWYRFVIMSSMP